MALTMEWVEEELSLCSKGLGSPYVAELCRFWLAHQWQPIRNCPVGKLVLLANVDRNRSDDVLGCAKDIGYLTEGGWFSTFNEHRAMSREAFTHWSEYPQLPDSPKETP